MEQDLIKNLLPIGLNDEEAQIYLASLALGPASVWNIYQKSGLKRTKCYGVLEDMVRRGFATKSNDGKRAIYEVIPPRELLSVLDRKKSEFEKTISQYEAISAQSGEKPSVRMYQGAEGVKQVYDMTLETPESEEIIFYSTNRVEAELVKYFETYLTRRVNRGIRCRGIFPDQEEIVKLISNRDKAELRESRFLPKENFYPFLDATVFGNKVAYISFSGQHLFATVIESAALAGDERQKFELLWKSARAHTNSAEQALDNSLNNKREHA